MGRRSNKTFQFLLNFATYCVDSKYQLNAPCPLSVYSLSRISYAGYLATLKTLDEPVIKISSFKMAKLNMILPFLYLKTEADAVS
jgi:hypothetical protein